MYRLRKIVHPGACETMVVSGRSIARSIGTGAGDSGMSVGGNGSSACVVTGGSGGGGRGSRLGGFLY